MIVSRDDISAQTNALRGEWSLLDTLNVDSTPIKKRSEVFQREYTQNGQTKQVYVKVYAYKKHAFERWGRRGRSRNESRNLVLFNKLGIPAAPVVAWCERRSPIGRIIEEYIITEAIEGAVPLDEFVEQVCADPENATHREYRDAIIDQLGRYTRLIHDHKFLHKDLKWRNVLARLVNGQVEIHWIDCPIGDFTASQSQFKRGCLKDCATLDKLAKKLCSLEERKQFVSSYLGEPIDSPQVEAYSKAINHYRTIRFDEKDAQQDEEARQRQLANELVTESSDGNT